MVSKALPYKGSKSEQYAKAQRPVGENTERASHTEQSGSCSIVKTTRGESKVV